MSEVIAQAIQSARYNEAVVVTVDNNDDNDVTNEQAREIVLVACLDSENGGIIWKDAAAAAAYTTHQSNADEDMGIIRHLRTKRWVLPMLNDHRRNDMYDRAIRSACRQKVLNKNTAAAPSNNEDDNVIRILDIGSGSGLLAMMGAQHTLDAIRKVDQEEVGGEESHRSVKDVHVTSIEMASAMARLARMTIKANTLDDKIKVVESHSMDANFCLDDTLFAQTADEHSNNTKADICTSELLESGLLGEGVLPSIRDAWSRHLKDDAVVIPRRARVFAVLVGSNDIDDKTTQSSDFFGPDVDSFKEASGVILSTTKNACPLLGRQNKSNLNEGISTVSNTEGILVSLHASSLLNNTRGEPLVKGLTDYNDYKVIPQKLKGTTDLPQKEHRGIRPLSDPHLVLDFDFASGLERLPPPTGRSFSKEIIATNDGCCTGVLFWWELDLGDEDDTTYSTKTIGFFGNIDDSKNWQDHWQQNLFLFGDTTVRKLVRGCTVQLDVSHDDTSIAFAIDALNAKVGDDISRPFVVNRYISSTRALQLNDVSRTRTLHDAIIYALETKGIDSPFLDLSDMGLCALMAAAAGATRVTSLESSSGGMPTLAATIAQVGNNLLFQIIQAQAEHVTSSYILGEVAEIVAAEPYYEMLEGWHLQEALNYFYLVRSLKQRRLISSSSISIPTVAALMAVVVEAEEFARAYSQVGDATGNVAGFNHSPVNFYGDRYHTYDVSLPVTEYNYRALSSPFCVAKLLYDEGVKEDGEWTSVKIDKPGKCQAVIFYVDYLCRVTDKTATHQKDGVYYGCISTAKSSHRQAIRKLELETVILSQSDVERGANFFCKASFDDATDTSIEEHFFEFKIVK
ncbi:hypothetical protein ACHAWC_010740 [Mediolabrus comicus]